MTTGKKISQIYCAPGEQIPKEVLDALKQANQNNKGDFSKYLKDIERIFNLSPRLQLTTENKFFFGGFIEGEGSLNVSIKKLKTAKFGILVDPEFSITQHVNGVCNLYAALVQFKTGRIRHKSGSNATFVFVIDNRTSLEEKVIPFLHEFVTPFSSPTKKSRILLFEKLLHIFKTNGHKDLSRLQNEILPLWDKMRMQKDQSNETFVDLKAAQDYISDCLEKKK